MDDANKDDKVLILSVRNLRQQAANCAIYEFEDLITHLSSASVWSPKSEQALSRKMYRTAKQFGSTNSTAQKVAAFKTRVSLKSSHELILVVADNVYQLHLLNQIKGWREHPAAKACYLAELWPGSLEDKFVLNEPFSDFDHIFVGLSNAVPILESKTGVSSSFLPAGVDTLKQKFRSDAPRNIDLFYPGRRLNSIHSKLLETRDNQNYLYIYDTIMGSSVENPTEHRYQYTNLISHSKFGFAFPAKMDVGGYTKNVSEIGWRYFELAAYGAIILGKKPDNSNFNTYFGWDQSVIEIDEETISDQIETLMLQPAEMLRISRLNMAESMLRNDWAYRWLEIINTFSLPATKVLNERLQMLKNTANSLKATI